MKVFLKSWGWPMDKLLDSDFVKMNLLWVLLIVIMSLAIGLFLIFKPSSAIELQRRFYELINWRIEPISMQKEIRNTKLMGLFLIIIVSLILLYLSFRR